MTTIEHPVFDHPSFPGNRKAVQDYLARQAQADKAQAKREFWFKIKFRACLLGSVLVGSFLFAVIFIR